MIGLFVCMSVCLLVTFMSSAEAAEPIVMLFEALTHMDPINHDLDAVTVGRTYSLPRGVARHRRGRLSSNFSDHLFIFCLFLLEYFLHFDVLRFVILL